MNSKIKKIVCALSSAVMLCGASALPASAKDPTLNLGDIRISDERLRPGKLGIKHDPYYISESYFEITSGETAELEVVCAYDHFIPSTRHAEYQWYRGSVKIEGATERIYKADRSGKYYCVVSEVKNKRVSLPGFERVVGNGRIFNEVAAEKQSKNTDDIISEKNKKELLPTYITRAAIVKKIADLQITKQPQGAHLIKGEPEYTLSIAVAGGTKFSDNDYKYEWKIKSESSYDEVVGETADITIDRNGWYKCFVSDSKGRKVESNEVYVEFDPFVVEGLDANYNDQRIKFKACAKGGTGKYEYHWIMRADEEDDTIVINSDDYGKNTIEIEPAEIYAYGKQRETMGGTAKCEHPYGVQYWCVVYELGENGKIIKGRSTTLRYVFSDEDKAFVSVYWGNDANLPCFKRIWTNEDYE